MPNQPRTPQQKVRVEAAEWDDFGAAVPDDTDRSKVLRAFIGWYLRRPGAKLPQRPPAS